jgi:predicted AAA+ superfamily ATPase
MPMPDLEPLIQRAEALLARLEQVLPPAIAAPDWSAATAFRWRLLGQRGVLQPVLHPHRIRLADLRGVDTQKQALERNLRQFVAGLPANNVLLWGSRGTGKSSLIKALLNEYADRGLRLIEVEKHHLVDLPDIVELLCERPERFLLFSDDLSFEQDDASYKALKSVLDGSVSATPDNVLICVTSNRRHLMPEYMRENLETHSVNGEIHHGEAVEEKVSLSERFGLWLSFYPFSQEQYLDIVLHWLRQLGVEPADPQATRAAALQWALARGSRSGRAARQFAQDWAGQVHLAERAMTSAPTQP